MSEWRANEAHHKEGALCRSSAKAGATHRRQDGSVMAEPALGGS